MKAKTGLNIPGNGDWSSDQEIFTSITKRWRQKLGYCSIFAAVPAVFVSHIPESRSDAAKKPQVSIAGKDVRNLEKLNMSSSKTALLKRQSEYRLPHQKGSLDILATLGGNDDCPGRTIPGGSYTTAAPFTDSGDTTGANDTVTRLQYYYNYDAAGPDHVYSFTLTGRGSNPQIEVSTTSGTYRPLIYVLYGGSAGACPAGVGATALNLAVISDSRWTPGSSTATLNKDQMDFLPLNVPLHLFVDSARNDATGFGPYTIRVRDVTIATTASNPVDSSEFFVRQHYLDFLNRDPDAGGLAYWTNRLTECGSDARCIHDRRIGVSAAFFVEMEFQETGYYVYRFYKASFGRQPDFTEFTSDRSRVAAGPNLEANKQSFAEDWVQRSAFVAAYPMTMSNTEVVNKLFDSAGLTAAIYNPLRQQETQAMNSGRSRALVLRDVIEIADFKNIPNPNDPRYNEVKQVSQYNPAFVLMQYFGYLRRNVDSAGYAFWLDVVNNREPNNYRAMVCAFLTSREYQLRFGSEVTRTNADCAQ